MWTGAPLTHNPDPAQSGVVWRHPYFILWPWLLASNFPFGELTYNYFLQGKKVFPLVSGFGGFGLGEEFGFFSIIEQYQFFWKGSQC